MNASICRNCYKTRGTRWTLFCYLSLVAGEVACPSDYAETVSRGQPPPCCPYPLEHMVLSQNLVLGNVAGFRKLWQWLAHKLMWAIVVGLILCMLAEGTGKALVQFFKEAIDRYRYHG